MNAMPVSPLYRRRVWRNRIGLTLSMLAMVLGLVALFWILGVLLLKGFSALSLNLFTHSTPAPGSPGGGLLNAIWGSVLMVAVCTFITTPIGIMAGIYLSEYGSGSRFAAVTRFITDIMLSAPSIVIGLFVYAFAVAPFGGFSGWAGSISLSLIALPVVCARPRTCCSWCLRPCVRPQPVWGHQSGVCRPLWCCVRPAVAW